MYLQNWIRRKNRKRKAVEELQNGPMPKKRQLSLWQQFLKSYAVTEGMYFPISYMCVYITVVVHVF